MSMNCYCPKEGNIYRNKLNEYLKEKHEVKKEKKKQRNKYNGLSICKKILSKKAEPNKQEGGML